MDSQVFTPTAASHNSFTGVDSPSTSILTLNIRQHLLSFHFQVYFDFTVTKSPVPSTFALDEVSCVRKMIFTSRLQA